MPGKLVHFDIPCEDLDKMAAFYRAVLGWKIEPYGGEEFGDYHAIDPTPGDESEVKGGMGSKGAPDQVPMNYYETDDLEAVNGRVLENGGRVIMEKMPVPGMGYFSVCLDPEGNVFGNWISDEGASM
jgi:uncharacterized protein